MIKSILYKNDSLGWQVMEALPSPLLMISKFNLISYMNHEAERILSVTLEEVMGQRWSDIISLRDQEGKQVSLQLKEIKQATRLPDNQEWWLVKTRAGSEIPVQLSVALVDSPDIEAVVVIHELSEIHHLVEHLHHQCSHDYLTGLVNRFEFKNRLDRAVESAMTGMKSHALLFMDLDNFKIVNDKYGHKAGDALLQDIAVRFRSTVRGRDTLARFGGDEFLLLLDHCDLDHAVKTAHLLRMALRKTPMCCFSEIVRTDVSIGIVVIDHNSPSPDTLIVQADAACYIAKEKTGGSVHVYQHGDKDNIFMVSKAS